MTIVRMNGIIKIFCFCSDGCVPPKCDNTHVHQEAPRFSQDLKAVQNTRVGYSDTWNSTLKIPLKGHGLRHVRVDLSGSVAEMIIRNDHL